MHKLDQAIFPEIKESDEFYCYIKFLASRPENKLFLEIGSSCGNGSTKAFVEGIEQNPERENCKLFCIESSKGRFSQLLKRYQDKSFVKPYNICSIRFEQYMTVNDILGFYHNIHTNLNNYPLETVLNWREEELNYIQDNGISEGGVERIKKENNINIFDIVLIDGSAFTAQAEIQQIYGAKYILLDDTNDIKNYSNYKMLIRHRNYILRKQNKYLRNGFAAFKLKDT